MILIDSYRFFLNTPKLSSIFLLRRLRLHLKAFETSSFVSEKYSMERTLRSFSVSPSTSSIAIILAITVSCTEHHSFCSCKARPIFSPSSSVFLWER